MIYKIKKGNHYSGFHFHPIFFKKQLEFSFNMSKECWFRGVDENDLDINKLFGVSFGLHHTNSIRLGWVPSRILQDKAWLYVYYYNNKRRSYKQLQGIVLGNSYDVKFYFDEINGSFSINIDNETYNFLFDFPKFKAGYRLFPYHGGEKASSYDYTIEINY